MLDHNQLSPTTKREAATLPQRRNIRNIGKHHWLPACMHRYPPAEPLWSLLQLVRAGVAITTPRLPLRDPAEVVGFAASPLAGAFLESCMPS